MIAPTLVGSTTPSITATRVAFCRILSGESGAAAFGCVAAILTDPALAHMRATLGLDETSRVLFFSTEGDTDKENYQAIVWDGTYPTQPAQTE